MSTRVRYAQVGVGGRHEMYRDAILGEFQDRAEMVGLCDLNEGRLRLSQSIAREKTGADIPIYRAQDFEKMVTETRPDCVIVTCKDAFHDHYICRAMELGCDAMTEKPMTTDEKKCQRIIDTQKKTGRKCTVTFNYRYSPPRTQVKDLLMSGAIGEVLSVDFQWMLDTSHGADYFRRWHRNRGNSGGLLVHKATHHFDLINWWLSTVPETVYAMGQRRFYTPETAERYGLTGRSERCHDCPEADRCRFSIRLKNNRNLRAMYLECESYDGYRRDGCVFSKEIDIEDSMSLVVRYANRVQMTYSLNAFCPWEGYMVVINGTRGRLENKCMETVYLNADGSIPGQLRTEGTWIRVYPHWQPGYSPELWTAKGGHGGGDPAMLRYLFVEDTQPEDKYMRKSDQRAGAWSILTGVAANRSMACGQPVRIADLVTGIGMPDYPAMPTGTEPLQMPARAAG